MQSVLSFPTPKNCLMPTLTTLSHWIRHIRHKANPIQKTIKPYTKSRYDNEICDALQIHRHTGHDIFGITQFPVLLHPNFRAVVGMHHHLHRGWGLSSATIFNWAYCVDSPNAPSNKKLAEHTERFNYDKSVYKYYKSATIHTHKKRIPKNLFFIIFGVILFGYFAVKMLFFNDNFFSKIYGVEQNSTKKTQQDDAINSTFSLSTDNQNSSQSESITQNNHEHHQDELHNRRLFLYQRDLPEDYIIRRQDPMLQVRGVMKMGNDCIAYNSYGDRMTLPINECLDYINNGKVYHSKTNSFTNNADFDTTQTQSENSS